MPHKIESLALEDARRIVVQSQQLPVTKQIGTDIDATLFAIEHLGYIQIDTISTIARAHHHTIWNRNQSYTKQHLADLVERKDVFEYWSHAAAYLPSKDYRFTLPRKEAIKSGKQKHWYKKDAKLMNSVLERIRNEGPLMAKDFDGKGKKVGDWTTKPAKQALENLYMEGELMISSRVNFHKVYNITDLVLPEDIDTSTPTQEEYFTFLIAKYLQANGVGQAAEMAYLLKNTKQHIIETLKAMVLKGDVLEVKINNTIYYTTSSALDILNNPLEKGILKILSPFDNLVIQRKRMQDIFNFNYLLECYVPKEKRKYGYFVLPILWNTDLVARVDCKADRSSGVLLIHHLFLEPSLNNVEEFAVALAQELKVFMLFNDCVKIKVEKTSPASFKSILNKLLR
ncbi:winged helix DNA-binding domain-containing protein [Cellulophaga sp. 20_2_10]|uniref:winged helix-turn-helix domain-containing protein n=1 Tax=Cellulophaga sp. 20_2_10 TaxID=2942476 RepID=UPI00201AAACC|nr:crosslink repair DNA glycosylase YcaQ family protein [Cellulophaga sp. 20_2_10]MCL5246219.1 winged helix DNA-binding domain-containing protein [Cellulophaga sp. 20_2_10]